MTSLVLLGKAGSGKSATGNSILGKKGFIESNLTDLPDVSNPVKQTTDVEGIKLTVIDGLDVCNCGDKADFSNVELALKQSGEGMSAFLIVLKYGDRFGEDQRKVVDMTKAIFGKDVIKTFGICILTFGDNFQRAVDEKEDSFKNVEEWFEQQGGSVQELFQECNKRCVLFNNRAKEEKEKKDQVHTLIKLVKSLNKENARKYTMKNYTSAEFSRSDLIKLFTQRKYEQEINSQGGGVDYLQKTIPKPEEFSKPPTNDFGAKTTPSIDDVCRSTNELQNTDIKSITSKSIYSPTTSNVENIVLSKSESDSQSADLLTFSEEEKMDVSEPLTPGKSKSITSILPTQYRLNPEPMENDSEKNTLASADLMDVSDRDEESIDVDTLEIEKLNKEIKKKEIELIYLYKTTLKRLDDLNDKVELRDLKKVVKEKMDFLTTHPTVYTEPKRQKLEDGNDEPYIKTPDQIHRSNEVTLLLVGSAGNGKSATGNSILGKQVFKTTASTSSQSSDFTMEIGTIEDRHVRVVDGPGIDTDKSPEEILNMSILTIEQALKLCDYRFSALLIVLKYGARFTKQESDFIKTVKGIMGKNVIRDFGVCIITHGDNFEADNEDENLTFKEWCEQQEGQIKDLLEECRYRCVLFNNRTKDLNLKELQVNELLGIISKDKSYSKEEFTAAFKDTQKMIIETNASHILEETKSFISKTRSRMAKIPPSTDMEKQFQSYEELLNEVNAFEQGLLDKYGDPENIKQSHLEIKLLRMEINSKLKNCLPMKHKDDISKEKSDKVPILLDASCNHPLSQSYDEKRDFVFVNISQNPCSRFTSVESYDERLSKDSKPFYDSDTEEQKSNRRRSQSGFSSRDYQFYRQSQSQCDSKIYERLNYYKREIDSMKLNNATREQWKLLRHLLESEEKQWNIEMIKCFISDPEYLEGQLFIIKGMIGEFMPKSDKSIWAFFKRFLPSYKQFGKLNIFGNE